MFFKTASTGESFRTRELALVGVGIVMNCFMAPKGATPGEDSTTLVALVSWICVRNLCVSSRIAFARECYLTSQFLCFWARVSLSVVLAIRVYLPILWVGKGLRTVKFDCLRAGVSLSLMLLLHMYFRIVSISKGPRTVQFDCPRAGVSLSPVLLLCMYLRMRSIGKSLRTVKFDCTWAGATLSLVHTICMPLRILDRREGLCAASFCSRARVSLIIVVMNICLFAISGRENVFGQSNSTALGQGYLFLSCRIFACFFALLAIAKVFAQPVSDLGQRYLFPSCSFSTCTLAWCE